MLHLYKYRTHPEYAAEFSEAYSYYNVRQVNVLSGLYLGISVTVRIISFFYYDQLLSMSNYMEYNLNNWLSVTGGAIFLVLSKRAMEPGKWTAAGRNLLTTFFCLFMLLISFGVSYIFSLHNPKNTLAVFLIGIVFVSVFFALDFKQIILACLFVLLLFTIGMVFPRLSTHEKLFNVIASGILVFFLYTCSRYSYYFKSEQFVKIRQLQERNAEIQLLNREKSEILAFVAHDLRNPLNNIEALSTMVLNEDKAHQNTELQLILTSARQAKHIINDLLEIVQQDKTPLKLQQTNLVHYLQGISESWQTNLNKERTINLNTSETELMAAINPSKLTRVMDNLIANGLKFSKSETPINIQISRSANTCTIQITDFGIGIPQHLQDLLFDQFSKAGRPGLKGEKSLGLGLHISRQIIEQHGGTLTVKSKENEGATFQITIPLLAA